MPALTDHVSTFVRACEAIQWRLIEGHSLTLEERDILEQTAVQLLMRVAGHTDSPDRPSSHKVWKRWDDELGQEPHP